MFYIWVGFIPCGIVGGVGGNVPNRLGRGERDGVFSETSQHIEGGLALEGRQAAYQGQDLVFFGDAGRDRGKQAGQAQDVFRALAERAGHAHTKVQAGLAPFCHHAGYTARGESGLSGEQIIAPVPLF